MQDYFHATLTIHGIVIMINVSFFFLRELQDIIIYLSGGERFFSIGAERAVSPSHFLVSDS